VSQRTGRTAILPQMPATVNGQPTPLNIWTSEGWLYLAVILDLPSRGVTGWAIGDRMKKDLAIKDVVGLRQPPEDWLFHSDRGSRYCSYDYLKKLKAYGLRPSISGKENCYDEASAKRFVKSLKA
jgi:transposase InsO family protein